MSKEPAPNFGPVDAASRHVGGFSALAKLIGVTPSAPHMWKARGVVPSDHCAAIEAATDRTVMRWDLRPDDWHRIWPELIGQPGAPAIPEPAKVV